MNLSASFCDPFKADIVELGDIGKDEVLSTFNNIPWKDYLERMDKTDKKDIYYSPSLEIENKDNGHGLSVSIVDDSNWYIFYKRPKIVKRFLGFGEKLDKNYMTEIHGQTEEDVRECLHALLKSDLQFLEDKIR